jgi:hypothetical protein
MTEGRRKGRRKINYLAWSDHIRLGTPGRIVDSWLDARIQADVGAWRLEQEGEARNGNKTQGNSELASGHEDGDVGQGAKRVGRGAGQGI